MSKSDDDYFGTDVTYSSPKEIFDCGKEQGAKEERQRIENALRGKCFVCGNRYKANTCVNCKVNRRNSGGGADYWVFAF